MRSRSLLSIVLLITPAVAHADTILVGTNLSAATQGGAAVLCPGGSDCTDRVSQFTFSSAEVITSISVVLTSPGDSSFVSNGDFTIGLGSQIGAGVTTGVGAGDIPTGPNGTPNTEKFTFSGLDIPLAAGTYYLGVAGGNVQWDYAPPLPTTAGALGLQLSCDPFISCNNNLGQWDELSSGTYALEIDGVAVTPEPSTLCLLGTGVLGLAGVVRRRVLSFCGETKNRLSQRQRAIEASNLGNHFFIRLK
jgi:PEP-CTERM motif